MNIGETAVPGSLLKHPGTEDKKIKKQRVTPPGSLTALLSIFILSMWTSTLGRARAFFFLFCSYAAGVSCLKGSVARFSNIALFSSSTL
jgi:hypothetical protein